MNHKYELTDEIREIDGQVLHRIRALKDFGIIHCGQLGGFIRNTDNLSQDGLSWVSDSAVVMDRAKVLHNAEVRDNAVVGGEAVVRDSAQVFGFAVVRDSARITDRSRVFNKARVCDFATVSINSRVGGMAVVCDCASIGGHVSVRGQARIKNVARVTCADVVDKDCVVSREPIFITGYPYNVLICDNRVKIGCQVRSLEEWEQTIHGQFVYHGFGDKDIWIQALLMMARDFQGKIHD